MLKVNVSLYKPINFVSEFHHTLIGLTSRLVAAWQNKTVWKMSWKLVQTWLRNPRNAFTLVNEFNVNLTTTDTWEYKNAIILTTILRGSTTVHPKCIPWLLERSKIRRYIIGVRVWAYSTITSTESMHNFHMRNRNDKLFLNKFTVFSVLQTYLDFLRIHPLILKSMMKHEDFIY